jgi:hypothetical protein
VKLWQVNADFVNDINRTVNCVVLTVQVHSLPLVLALVALGGSGSALVNSGSARLEKVLRSWSTGLSSSSCGEEN